MIDVVNVLAGSSIVLSKVVFGSLLMYEVKNSVRFSVNFGFVAGLLLLSLTYLYTVLTFAPAQFPLQDQIGLSG